MEPLLFTREYLAEIGREAIRAWPCGDPSDLLAWHLGGYRSDSVAAIVLARGGPYLPASAEGEVVRTILRLGREEALRRDLWDRLASMDLLAGM